MFICFIVHTYIKQVPCQHAMQHPNFQKNTLSNEICTLLGLPGGITSDFLFQTNSHSLIFNSFLHGFTIQKCL